jgi:CRISPR/Cas system-associated exonuclease Cas4 (RecB family)
MRLPEGKHGLVRASEISEYLFCRRSWYLSAQGIRPSLTQIDRMRAGVARHRRHGRLVQLSQRLTTVAAFIFIFALVMAAGYWWWTHAH